MNIEELYSYCLAKKGVTEHFPFDEETLVFKVGGKIFLLSSLTAWEKGTPAVNLKCDPEKALQLRDDYDAIKPGYHMNKTHWNTVSLKSDVTDKLLRQLIDHSYELIYNSLSKKIKETII